MTYDDNLLSSLMRDRLVVRRGELAWSTVFGVVDVEAIACAINNSGSLSIMHLKKAEFEASCRMTMKKTRLVLDQERPSDFMPAQKKSKLLAAVHEDGTTISILDGVKRAEAYFLENPNGHVEVALVGPEGVRELSSEIDPESTLGKMLETMKETPLYLQAGDGDLKGGDLLATAVHGERGRPKAGPIEEYLEACAALCGFELIARAKKTRPKDIADDYNMFLASRKTVISGKTYKAYHPPAKDDPENPPPEYGGRYGTWKRWQKLSAAKSAHEAYFRELGFKIIPAFPIDPAPMSDEDLDTTFVLATRALEAWRRLIKALKDLTRLTRGRDGNPEAASLEEILFRSEAEQNQVWLDWPAQKELALRLGVNAADFFANMVYAHDILQWWSHVFFVKRGLWRPIQMQSEAEQFLMWLGLMQTSAPPVREGDAGTRHRLEWKLIFQTLEHLPSVGHAREYGWITAQDHAFHNCMASLARVSKVFVV